MDALCAVAEGRAAAQTMPRLWQVLLADAASLRGGPPAVAPVRLPLLRNGVSTATWGAAPHAAAACRQGAGGLVTAADLAAGYR